MYIIAVLSPYIPLPLYTPFTKIEFLCLNSDSLMRLEAFFDENPLANFKEDFGYILTLSFLTCQMLSHRHGPVEEKLRCKEKEKKEVCQNRDEVEAVSKAELDSLKSAVDAIRTTSLQISRYTHPGYYMYVYTYLCNQCTY